MLKKHLEKILSRVRAVVVGCCVWRRAPDKSGRFVQIQDALEGKCEQQLALSSLLDAKISSVLNTLDLVRLAPSSSLVC